MLRGKTALNGLVPCGIGRQQSGKGRAVAAVIWGGAILTLAGIAGLIFCVVLAMRAKREGLTGVAMEARLRRVVTLNLGALAISALGLMLVIVGVILS